MHTEKGNDPNGIGSSPGQSHKRSPEGTFKWLFITFLCAPLPMLMIIPGWVLSASVWRAAKHYPASRLVSYATMLSPGMLICSIAGVACCISITSRTSKEQRMALLKQTTALTIALSATFSLVPHLVYKVIAGDAASYDFVTPVFGFIWGMCALPIVPAILPLAANILLIRYRPDAMPVGQHTATVVLSSWIGQYICIVIYATWLAST